MQPYQKISCVFLVFRWFYRFKKEGSLDLKSYLSLVISLRIPYFQPQVPYKGVPYKKKRVSSRRNAQLHLLV